MTPRTPSVSFLLLPSPVRVFRTSWAFCPPEKYKPDIFFLLIKLSQDHLSKKLMFYDSVQCTILEKKVDEGLGLSLDVILINGTLHVGDTIVMTGLNGPIVTQIRALLTPEPMRDARVKVCFSPSLSSVGYLRSPRCDQGRYGSEDLRHQPR